MGVLLWNVWFRVKLTEKEDGREEWKVESRMEEMNTARG